MPRLINNIIAYNHEYFVKFLAKVLINISNRRVTSQFFSGKPEGPFCLSCTFIFPNERNLMKKSARVSEKLVIPGLPGLQVATRLNNPMKPSFVFHHTCIFPMNLIISLQNCDSTTVIF